MSPLLLLLLLLTLLTTATTALDLQLPTHNDHSLAGNPVINGWYADPEARIFISLPPSPLNTTNTTSFPAHTYTKNYWIYPTTSAPYDEQTTFTAFSSPNLLTWTTHHSILNITKIPWSTNRAAWAPSVVQRHGQYFMYFSAGDSVGIGVAKSVTGRPEGPFEDVLGRPLVPGVVRDAQAIDPQVFVDYEEFDNDNRDPERTPGGLGVGGYGSGRNWLYFGGWGHAMVVELGDDMVSLRTGEFVEITPEGYVEGPWVTKRDGVYYFMFSVGGWHDNSYAVHYITGPTPTGPFTSAPTPILHGNEEIGTSTGHNSVFTPDGENYYIVYHRRLPGDDERDHRVVCIDRLVFERDDDDDDGQRGGMARIRRVVITDEGVEGWELN